MILIFYMSKISISKIQMLNQKLKIILIIQHISAEAI
jgi:hypothetical protein